MAYNPLSEREEEISKKIVDASYVVHKNLGPGLLEKVYSPRWIVVFHEMYFFNGVITIFEKIFKVIYNCIQWGKTCLCHELAKRDLKYKRQIDIPIVYDGITFNEGLRLDVLVEDLIICEIKAVDQENPVWIAQILSHLKLLNKRLGFLINFNVPVIKSGIKRIIN